MALGCTPTQLQGIILTPFQLEFYEISRYFRIKEASLVAQTVKHLPAVQETRLRSLGWEDPLEKEMATDSSILAWIIPWAEDPAEVCGVTKSLP